MKRTLIIGALVALFGVALFLNYFPSSMSVDNTQNETREITVEKEVVVDNTEKRIREAQAEAMADIEAKANQMRDEFIQNELKKVEGEVLAEVEAEVKQRRIEVEKQTGAYWRDVENVKALIRATFPEAPQVALQIAWMESEYQMVQSKERYTRDRPEYGVKAGDRELSFCMFQIHKPAHHKTAVELGLEDYATNVESCVKMARVVYDQRGNFTAWSVYKSILAMR